MKRKNFGLFTFVLFVACIFSLVSCGAGNDGGSESAPDVVIPEGYTVYNDGHISFAYPDDWVKTDGEVVVIKKLGGAGNNITVVYENKTDMYEKLTLAGFNAQMKPAYEAAGMTISDAKVEHKTVGGEKIAVISYSAIMSGQALKQTAYAVTSGARTYSITVTEFSPDAELVKNIFDTLRVVKQGATKPSASTTQTTAAPSGCAKHDYGDWEEIKAPTCAEKGEKQCVCELCGYTLSVPVPKMTEHSFSDTGKCGVCGVKMDENFVFTLNEDKKSYSFGYRGPAEGTVRVPREYNGLPVTKISDCAFFLNNNVVSVKLPDTIVEIGEEAFKGCSSMKDFYIPESVRVIGKGAFEYCDLFATVKIPEGVERIEEGTFAYSGAKTIVFPKSLKYIGKEAFVGCEGIKSVSIPASVEEIGKYAFSGTKNLGSIVFGGTEEEWNKISFGELWDGGSSKYKITFNN